MKDTTMCSTIGFAVLNSDSKAVVITPTFRRSQELFKWTINALPIDLVKTVSTLMLRVILKNDSVIDFYTADSDLRGFHFDAAKIVQDEYLNSSHYKIAGVIL